MAATAISHLWDNLSRLSVEDPDQYRAVVQATADEATKARRPPLPHVCLRVRGKKRVRWLDKSDDLGFRT